MTGHLDPSHNKHKFYCQICKSNVSIHSKGAREIVRHYQSEAHLRKDQRWRFEHLGKVDKLTGLTVHAVRGKDEHLLSALELEKEKPLFETAPLIDIEPQFPFYDDYMANAGRLTNLQDVRLGTQISLIGGTIPHFGNLALLEGLWAEVGNFTNHQDTFRQLDWSFITLTVSTSISLMIKVEELTLIVTKGCISHFRLIGHGHSSSVLRLLICSRLYSTMSFCGGWRTLLSQ